MQRRTFWQGSAAAGIGLLSGVSAPAQAQQPTTLIEGQHYQRLQTPVATGGQGPEVLEFFWYGCPFCYKFDPTLSAWEAHKPAKVAFRRIPTIIHGASREHQKLFFALELMGMEHTVHAQVFTIVQSEPEGLNDLPSMQALVRKLGGDADKFAAMYKSFGLQARCQGAATLFGAAGLTSVPSLLINGRYVTSPSMAGGADQAIHVVDALLARGTA
ncbi:thiol:disulfide interchange protein DsbA/DsbL [Paucibacter sp. R3-3]|uniref:Thiol:disulfide interchange protein n=1 Tax=Roseateles agri TaxID=3098619 RepID=A0ABU5DPH0_9BURK|nr:thiol:disulfide interchange protein DsbA/DsbL [Paucibacter sp. R3-3]MDY0747999.1 thiol:disulfide interchange protein DsbA/DsbL [Paucibacter sp. R3-3]